MAKYRPFTYAQEMLIPVSLKEQLMPGNLEYEIHTLVDKWMDVSLFYEKYRNDEAGRQPYHCPHLHMIQLSGKAQLYGLTSL
jgi:hypothetical protein